MNDISIIGAGAWGCALAIQATRAGSRVTLWARDPALAASRLPASLAGTVRLSGDLAAMPARLMLLTVPVQFLRGVAALLPSGPVIVGAKGIEAGTLALPLEILLSLDPARRCAVLTGPNLAHEIAAGGIAAGLPAAAVIAGADPALREAATAALATPEFRLYGNDDAIGAQLGGAAKNVIAIAAGAVIGAGLGENARAALITRGLAEIARLATALGGHAETVAGLSGLGDLVLTATAPTSRNYSLGLALGCGELLADILAGRQSVTEGVATAPALVARAASAGLELPIAAAVSDLLAGRLTLDQAIRALLARKRRDE